MRNDDEFSASACQKIHSELLASVNEIYKNLKTKPLLIRNAVSTSSLSNNSIQNSRKLSKSKSIDYNKQNNSFVSLLRNKPRAESVGPVAQTGQSNKLPKHLKKRLEKHEAENRENNSLENLQHNNQNVSEQMALLKLIKPKRAKSSKRHPEVVGWKVKILSNRSLFFVTLCLLFTVCTK